MTVAYQNAWEKLRKYYELTNDAHSIYAAAILLHPSYRRQYFEHNWTGEEEVWKELMIENVKKTWQDEYQPLIPSPNTLSQSQQQQARKSPSIVSLYLRRAQAPPLSDDEFDSYINGPPTVFDSPQNIIPWLRSQSNPWQGIKQMALDLLSIPAMSTELERVFSQAKLTISPIRSSLSSETIETLELMRYWWSNNIISQRRGGGAR